MAQLRHDRAIALDAGRGAGSLAALLNRGDHRRLDDLLSRLRGADVTLTQLDAWLGSGRHGLRVLCTPPDPPDRANPDAAALRAAILWLHRFAGLLIIDCATELDAPATRAAIETADQVLVVTDADAACCAALRRTVDTVRPQAPWVLVVANGRRRRPHARDVGRLAISAPAADGLIAMPWSPPGAAQLGSGEFDWALAPAEWVRSAHELAATLVAGWSRLGLAV